MTESIQTLPSSLGCGNPELREGDLHHLVVRYLPHQDMASDGSHELLAVEVPQLPGLVDSIAVNLPDDDPQLVFSTLL